MANEFIARKGLIVLANGIVATGSTSVNGDITASGDVVAVNFRGSGQYLTNIAADSVQFANVLNKPTLVSSSTQFNTITDPFTGSFTGSFTGDGSQLTGIATTLSVTGSTSGTDSVNLKTEGLVFSGSSNVTATVTNNTVTIGVSGLVSQSSQISYSGLSNIPDGIVSSSTQFTNLAAPFTGSFTGSFKGDGSQLTGVAATNVEYANVLNKPALVSASSQIDHDLTTNFVANEHIDHSSVSISAGNGLSGGGDITTTRTLSLDTGSTHFTNGVKTKLNTEGVFSSSVQVDVRNTTGIATIATTGSNTFTGVQTISNTTNSTVFNNGALIVAGGVGIAKDVNISGSLTVTGLLTAVSTSVQYVTSSQLNVADNKIVVNTNDLVRFGGLSVIDSGSSSPTTASIYWDSLAHHFIYENLSGSAYNSAVIIAGPKNTGALGNEAELITGRIPVASGGDHIDTGLASSSMYVEFPSRRTHVEAGLYVTGAITSSVGFSGDGSNLTGVVSTLSVTGSESGTGTINLKTQGLIVSGTNGVVATANGQTLTISGSNATTTTKGVASFNSTNFTVTGGEVTSNNITINGGTVTLGGTRNITLAQITTQGATTTDAVTLSGGATIGSAFQTSSTYVAAGPTTNEVVLSLATGSFDAAHFDYVLKSGANLRTGTVMSIWTGGSIEFTDTSTNDIGNTRNADFTVDTNA